jgi:endonuclease/exonuclease/phosphatase family metal-dependent hydrolase
MVRLILYNIEYCEGITGSWWEYCKFWRTFFPPKQLDQRIVDELKKLNPDVVALVEVDTGSFRAKKDEVVFFGDCLKMKSFVEKIKYPFNGWLKLFHYVPILKQQANAIIAKEMLTDIRYHVLHEGTKRLVIEATLNQPKKITLLLAHLSLRKKKRVEQMRELANIVNCIKNPVILMGDFNTFNGEEEIEELLETTHLNHKFKRCSKLLTLTQPTKNPKRRLDYILTSEKIKVITYEVLKFPFSDHLPVMVDFEIM